MKLLDIVTGPWAIVPAKLTEIQGIYGTHLRGEKINFKAIEDRIGKPLSNEPTMLENVNGVGVIHVEGVLSKKMNLLMEISGGTSYQILERDFKKALADSDITSILLLIDSPGGHIDGLYELANLIYESRSVKPVVAFTDGMMASAAYAIAASADKIYISTGGATDVGSIGVVAQHVDYSKQNEQMGVGVTEIYAGKYKRIASATKPLSEEGNQYIQDQVDYLYALFVDKLAEYRGVSSEEVLTRMADGRMFIGLQAIEAGLVDEAITFDQLLENMSAGVADSTFAPASSGVDGNAAISDNQKEITTMSGDKKTGQVDYSQLTAQMLEAHAPDLFKQITQAGHDEGHVAGAQKGAEDERARIQAVKEQSMAGHEELIATLMFDGKTTGAQAAVQVLSAHKASLAKQSDAIKADANQPVDSVSAESVDEADAQEKAANETKGFMALVTAKMSEDKELTRGQAIKAVAQENPDAHDAYVKAQKAGTK